MQVGVYDSVSNSVLSALATNAIVPLPSAKLTERDAQRDPYEEVTCERHFRNWNDDQLFHGGILKCEAPNIKP